MKELPEVFKKNISFSYLEKIQDSIGSLNYKEKIVFWVFVFILVLSTFVILFKISNQLTVEVPRSGGEIVEGVIGSPRFINPVLAMSDSDRDLTSLIYSGLIKATPEGELVNDLAENYKISEDGLEYMFKIKDDAKFHDGVSVTSDDVVFTVELAKNDLLKSPKRASWEGVGVEKIDEKSLVFHLKEPYSPFLENMVMGVLPKHIWRDLSIEQITFSDYNNKPVGSGPYKIKRVNKSSGGIPESYELEAFDDYAPGKPYINEVTIVFFDSEEDLINAFNKKEVSNIHAISPERAKDLEGENIVTSPLPRVFGLFFNQNQKTLFTNKEVRVALNEAINKDLIISKVLNNFGTSIDGPLPPGAGVVKNVQNKKSTRDYTSEALATLENAGWKKGEDGVMEKKTKKETFKLSFSISTSNAPELKAVANILKEEWSKIGAKVELEFFETGSLNQEVIRPRKYDSLLFGEIIGRDFDLFAFWHSSQRNDPGLNIALYTNITSDKILEKIRTTGIKREKEDLYIKFENEIEKDRPAVFLYSPDFIYISNKTIKGMNLGVVTTPGERFLNISNWHLKTDRVWPFFIKN